MIISIVNRKLPNKLGTLSLCAAAVALVLSGCSSSSSSSTPVTPPATMTGTVSAPGGLLAFNRPGRLQQMFTGLFGASAYADISGLGPVGAGVTLELIEVDAAGNQVGGVLATTTTDANGAYVLTLPDGFVAASKYVVRATGSTDTMDTRVISSASNNVDPLSDAVSDLVTDQLTDLTAITPDEIAIMTDAVNGVAQTIDATGLTAAALSTALQTECKNDDEVLNQITSSQATGQICGTVKDSSNVNLENILIVVRDFGNWVTRAKMKTDSAGSYCVNVPDGDYILGALNFTEASTAASEWWSSTGDKYTQFGGEKITVAATAVTKDFTLEPGVRVQGTVSASGTALEGIQVTMRTYQDAFPLGSKLTNASGGYRMNVIPGDYTIETVNHTVQPYGSEMYDGANGTSYRYQETKLSLATAGVTTPINFDLATGYKLYGQVLDAPAGNPVAGVRVNVDIDNGASGSSPSYRLRTNKEGKYRVWLQPNKYFVSSHGQSTSVSLDLTASDQNQDFTAAVGTVTATIKKADATAVSQAKVYLAETTAGSTISQEISNSDGTVTLYTPTTGNYLVYVRIDSDHGSAAVDAADRYASVVYDGTPTPTGTVLLTGTQVAATVDMDQPLGDLTLPDAGLLTVNVTTDGTTPVSDYRGQIRSGSGAVGGGVRMLTHRTNSEGSFKMSLPAGTYGIRMMEDNVTTCIDVVITAGQSATVNYRTDTDVCS